jgi:flagellar hook protein FlgE
MMDSIMIGTAGLLSFTKGLTNISNNVANMNTAGFKSYQVNYGDLFYRYQFSGNPDQQGYNSFSFGNGVAASNSHLSFTDGQFRSTGNSLDVALTGHGLFVLQKDGQTYYTRDGEFKIDGNGYLVASSDGARVAGYSSSGGLEDISINGARSNAAQSTQNIKFANSLSASSTTASVQSIAAYDSLGVKHLLTLNLTRDTTTTSSITWNYTLMNGSTTVTSGSVQYDSSGSPVAGSDTQTFSYSPGAGAAASNVTLDFSNTTYLSATSSTLSVGTSDGYAAGYLSSEAIDTSGNLVLTYSNGQTVKSQKLAIAWFDNVDVLKSHGGNRYAVAPENKRTLGTVGNQGLGTLQVGGVELSNVDQSTEFSELIVIQRGYQASSQVITAANEMIQQLGDLRGRK